jgi:hypothetical protein
MTISETLDRLKGVDRRNVRTIPENPHDVYGRQLIQIMEGSWTTLTVVENRKIADGILDQVVSRIILG